MCMYACVCVHWCTCMHVSRSKWRDVCVLCTRSVCICTHMWEWDCANACTCLNEREKVFNFKFACICILCAESNKTGKVWIYAITSSSLTPSITSAFCYVLVYVSDAQYQVQHVKPQTYAVCFLWVESYQWLKHWHSSGYPAWSVLELVGQVSVYRDWVR